MTGNLTYKIISEIPNWKLQLAEEFENTHAKRPQKVLGGLNFFQGRFVKISASQFMVSARLFHRAPP